jgi:hypothetical protein
MVSKVTVGDIAYDVRRDRYGVVMDRMGGRIFLRPERGGVEWEARHEEVRPARAGKTASESLSPRVATANARSRGEIL